MRPPSRLLPQNVCGPCLEHACPQGSGPAAGSAWAVKSPSCNRSPSGITAKRTLLSVHLSSRSARPSRSRFMHEYSLLHKEYTFLLLPSNTVHNTFTGSLKGQKAILSHAHEEACGCQQVPPLWRWLSGSNASLGTRYPHRQPARESTLGMRPLEQCATCPLPHSPLQPSPCTHMGRTTCGQLALQYCTNTSGDEGEFGKGWLCQLTLRDKHRSDH